MRLVEVEWVDSHVHDRWVTLDELAKNKVARCVSVGYLVQDEPDFVTLAQSQGKDDEKLEEFGQPITIPRVALVGEPRDVMPIFVRKLEKADFYGNLTGAA